MAISKERKTGIISDYRRGGTDTGSPEVQIALLTARINDLNDHFRNVDAIFGRVFASVPVGASG